MYQILMVWLKSVYWRKSFKNIWLRFRELSISECSRLIAQIFTPVLSLFVIGAGLGSAKHL